ncbi:MAG: hypothetical protein IJJ23_08615, partial [Clostridia bacterium]|nr:hypothetical protein [Clostridia bacterium]
MTALKRNLITAYVLIGIALMASVLSLQGALLTAFSQTFQLSGSAQGYANTSAFIGSIIALLSAFYLQSRMTKHALLRVALMVCALSLAALSVVPGYGLFNLSWFVLGVAVGWMDALLSACIADLFTGRMARIMMCMLHMLFGLSSAVSPLIYASVINAGVYWQRIYLPIGVIAFVLAVISFLGRRFGVSAGETLSARGVVSGSMLGKVRERHLLPLCAAMFFHGFFLSGLNTWINRFCEGMTGMESIPAMSCLFLGIMLCRLIMPFLPVSTDNYVRYAGIAAGVIFALGIFTHSGLVIRLCVFLTGFTFGALIPCI